MMERWPRIFTWNVNPAYLLSLAKASFEIYIPTDKAAIYAGQHKVVMGSNVHEVAPEDVKSLELDCIIFQSPGNYLIDQHILFSPDQHTLPKIYLEHEPPSSPADSFHIVDDPDITLIHTSYFNKMMWDNNHTPVRVIEFGITDPGIPYTGELERGIVCVDNFMTKGRRGGLDILLEIRKKVPIDVIGVGSQKINGLGEVTWNELAEFIAPYRFYFNPARYRSNDLVMYEAMMMGVPVITLPTTNSPEIILNGVSGFMHLDTDRLIETMTGLLDNPARAIEIGQEGRQAASQRFNINRFTGQWEDLVMELSQRRHPLFKTRRLE